MKRTKIVDQIVCVVLLLCILSLDSGCSSHSIGLVDYRYYNMYSATIAGNLHFEEIVPIREQQSGFVWNSCTQVTTDVARKLFDRARAMGGNGLTNVRWFDGSTDRFGNIPTCETQWGWFFALILPGFGPWVTVATAEASIVKLSEKQLKRLEKRGEVIPLRNEQNYLAWVERNIPEQVAPKTPNKWHQNHPPKQVAPTQTSGTR